MAALLVALSVMAIMLSVAMPAWSQMIRRDKEEELIFRGTQYARAINQYQRKFANASPASLDVLIEQRLLRKKFRDPMSPNKDGEFQLLYLQNQSTDGAGRGQASRSSAGAGSPTWLRGMRRRLSGRRLTGRGGIVGVASKNTGQSILDLQRQKPLQRVAVHRNGNVPAGRRWWRRRTRRTSTRWTRRRRQTTAA